MHLFKKILMFLVVPGLWMPQLLPYGPEAIAFGFATAMMGKETFLRYKKAIRKLRRSDKIPVGSSPQIKMVLREMLKDRDYRAMLVLYGTATCVGIIKTVEQKAPKSKKPAQANDIFTKKNPLPMHEELLPQFDTSSDQNFVEEPQVTPVSEQPTSEPQVVPVPVQQKRCLVTQDGEKFQLKGDSSDQCPICMDSFNIRDEVASCRKCTATLHKDCFDGVMTQGNKKCVMKCGSAGQSCFTVGQFELDTEANWKQAPALNKAPVASTQRPMASTSTRRNQPYVTPGRTYILETLRIGRRISISNPECAICSAHISPGIVTTSFNDMLYCSGCVSLYDLLNDTFVGILRELNN